MPEATLLAVFLVGLLGGGLCAGMCGGIVSALSAGAGSRWLVHLAYNTGRIASYTLAGAIAGALGGMALYYDLLPLQLAFYVFANLMLILLGLYLAGWASMVTRLGVVGRRLWRHISPLIRRFLPVNTLPRALMLAFGLGTLPNMLLAGVLLSRARSWFQGRMVRWVLGGLVLGFDIAGLANAAHLGGQIRRGALLPDLTGENSGMSLAGVRSCPSCGRKLSEIITEWTRLLIAPCAIARWELLSEKLALCAPAHIP